MNSYLYPTHSDWFSEVLEDWKSSGKRYLCFPFLWFEPHTLPENNKKEFWLYLYYSEKSTEKDMYKRLVQYRAKVILYSSLPMNSNDIYLHQDNNAKMYFKCDVVEELRKENGGYLKDSDFIHAVKGQNLLASIRNSIAPIQRVSPALTVQRTMYWLND